MPYVIKKVKENGQTGYKVCKKDEPAKCFSKKALTEEKAKKQRTAIILSELGLSQKRGGVGSDMPEDPPKTIPMIKEALIEHGFEDEVFDMDLAKPKPKKADWEKLYRECLDSYRKRGPSAPSRDTTVKDMNEAFRQLGITSKKSPKS